MTGALLGIGAFAVLFAVLGFVKLSPGCAGDGDCTHCHAGQCTRKDGES